MAFLQKYGMKYADKEHLKPSLWKINSLELKRRRKQMSGLITNNSMVTPARTRHRTTSRMTASSKKT